MITICKDFYNDVKGRYPVPGDVENWFFIDLVDGMWNFNYKGEWTEAERLAKENYSVRMDTDFGQITLALPNWGV